MAKRAPRLHFSKEEMADPAVKKAAEKASEKMDRLEKAESRIPKKKVLKKTTVQDPSTGTIKTKLCFEETDKKKPSKLSHAARDAPVRTVSFTVHEKLRENGQDNVGVESADHLEQAAEGAGRTIRAASRSRRLRPYRAANRAEKQTDRANRKALYETAARTDQPNFHSNPYSRWQQRREIKKQYAAAKSGQTAQNTLNVSATVSTATEKAAAVTQKTQKFVRKNKKWLVILGGAFVLLVCLPGMGSLVTLLFQSSTAEAIATYPSEDEDMLAAEEQYCAMEQELQDYLDNYETTHDYDEYVFDLDEIGHDPYVLISAVTALYGGAWTVDEVGDILQQLFDQQYILEEEVETETRYRYEQRTGSRSVYDPEAQAYVLETYTYTARVPYTYTTCTVTLTNLDLSHVPVQIMTEEQLSMYAMYMSTLGNRPDLFPSSTYISAYYDSDYNSYEIPAEALEDEQFKKMITEAEKYLGYPYVWGGSSPSTSFDCSGFVSWVINNCGVGWSVGRLTAQGLCNICTRTSNPQPGDLVFFINTYETTEISHVGIYVGNNMMIHCGDPIQYASLNSSYWQAHLWGYGRLPNP